MVDDVIQLHKTLVVVVPTSGVFDVQRFTFLDHIGATQRTILQLPVLVVDSVAAGCCAGILVLCMVFNRVDLFDLHIKQNLVKPIVLAFFQVVNVFVECRCFFVKSRCVRHWWVPDFLRGPRNG